MDHGTADHAAWEHIAKGGDLDSAKGVFREQYADGINRAAEVTPNLSYWFSSGPYDGWTDVERRYGIGLEMVQRFHDWWAEQAPRRVLWVSDDGTPGAELAGTWDADGIDVRYVVDLVTLLDGEPEIIDGKTGDSGDLIQLETYGVAVKDVCGLDIKSGWWWRGKTGRLSRRKDLSGVSRQEIVERYHQLDEDVRAERFDPKPGPACERCDVRTSCDFAI